MPRLEVEIGGNASGLGKAASQALGILENLQNTANELKVDLFKATDVVSLNAIGNTLTNVTGQIRDYTSAAIQGSKAFQDQQSASILENLNTKLTVLNGNAQIFGVTVQNQKAQVSAYEAAINKLLANGLSPLDSKITSLKTNIDSLNATMAANASNVSSNVNAQYQATGRLIPDLEAKIKRLKTALSGATDERGIVQYNIRLRAAQTELERLRSLGVTTGTTLVTQANNAANAARRLSGGYNAVGLEFGRIIQDAPFAANNFGAVGNNITRLVEVLPGYITQTRAAIVAQGGVATSANVARTALAGLFTGFGGVTIAISALVAGYVFYQQYQQKVKREQDALNGTTKEYIETLKGVERSQLAGAKTAQEDLVRLKALYGAYQDANMPLKERRTAYEQIQQLYPDYFKNLSFEEVASGKTKKAYDSLTSSILASAKARAAVNLITKNAERQLENENKLVKLNIEYGKQKAKLDAASARKKVVDTSIGAGTGELSGAQSQAADRENAAFKATAAIATDIKNIKRDTSNLTKENITLEKEANAQIAKGGTLIDLNNKKKAKEVKDTITPKVDRTTNDADLAGLQGVDIATEKIRQKYVALNDELTKAAAKKGADISKIDTLRAQAQVNEAKEITQVIIGERTRVAEEIQRIENESGIKGTENRAKELLQIQKWYDEQIIKAQGNAEILKTIEEGKQQQIATVVDKYAQKRLEAETKIVSKIEKETDKSFTLNDNHTKKASQKIDEELQKRLKAVKEYFNELRKLYATDPMAQAALNITENTVTEGITDKANTAKDGGLSKELSRGVSKFGTDFFKVLSTINQQADQTFSTIVGNLARSLTDSLSDVFLNIFQKKLTAIMDDAFASMSESQQQLAGAAILAGSVISGAFPKTSKVGQAAGGALKGAGTGAILGSAIPGIGTVAGAVVGGLVGAIGGLFGASKAKKQEELQKKQLAEQEKQTKLLERQNALAYTASIIGRMTTNGIVTGVEVNEFGQLTTKISGQDLLVTLDRANRSRQRGT